MRIVSLLPSTTEIVCALGLSDALVAVTHECDYPPEVLTKPIITRSSMPHTGLTSAEIDTLVAAQVRDQLSIYALDEQLLATLQPNLILTQALCEVCAVAFDQVQRAVRDLGAVGDLPRILSLEPTTLEGIFETIEVVGAATATQAQAHALTASLRQRLQRVAERVAQAQVARPRVACFEWLDPIFGPGHWVPEMVTLAGGEPVLGQAGQVSPRVAWDDVCRRAPEVIVLTCCGFNVERTLEEAAVTLPQRPGWERLPAVQAGRVYAVDGNAFFSRPGPRVVEGLELLAHLLHPQLFPELAAVGEAVVFDAATPVG